MRSPLQEGPPHVGAGARGGGPTGSSSTGGDGDLVLGKEQCPVEGPRVLVPPPVAHHHHVRDMGAKVEPPPQPSHRASLPGLGPGRAALAAAIAGALAGALAGAVPSAATHAVAITRCKARRVGRAGLLGRFAGRRRPAVPLRGRPVPSRQGPGVGSELFVEAVERHPEGGLRRWAPASLTEGGAALVESAACQAPAAGAALAVAPAARPKVTRPKVSPEFGVELFESPGGGAAHGDEGPRAADGPWLGEAPARAAPPKALRRQVVQQQHRRRGLLGKSKREKRRWGLQGLLSGPSTRETTGPRQKKRGDGVLGEGEVGGQKGHGPDPGAERGEGGAVPVHRNAFCGNLDQGVGRTQVPERFVVGRQPNRAEESRGRRPAWALLWRALPWQAASEVLKERGGGPGGGAGPKGEHDRGPTKAPAAALAVLAAAGWQVGWQVGREVACGAVSKGRVESACEEREDAPPDTGDAAGGARLVLKHGHVHHHTASPPPRAKPARLPQTRPFRWPFRWLRLWTRRLRPRLRLHRRRLLLRPKVWRCGNDGDARGDGRAVRAVGPGGEEAPPVGRVPQPSQVGREVSHRHGRRPQRAPGCDQSLLRLGAAVELGLGPHLLLE
mmetsp:Transcript_69819/g.157814  ORF Transcript_69819/g.157814 Transcript_69819/m.157814 type:complete len:615 (-) Transcript_69819:459-2303(-)